MVCRLYIFDLWAVVSGKQDVEEIIASDRTGSEHYSSDILYNIDIENLDLFKRDGESHRGQSAAGGDMDDRLAGACVCD